MVTAEHESVLETSDDETLSLTSEEVARLAELFRKSMENISTSFHYTIESSLTGARQATFPSRDPESSLTELINQFRKQPRIEFGNRIADRLHYLLEVSHEEFPEQAPPAAGSLKSFLAFLVNTQGLSYPAVVLTFSGNVRAEWTRSPIEHFAIEFCEDESVRFVIFAPDPKRPYMASRISGSATMDSVMALAEYYQVSRWVIAESVQAA